jgi:hypothetical protein
VRNHRALGLAAAIVAIAQEPPETTPLVDDEDVELGFCVGVCRLEVDEVASSDDDELVLVLVSDEPDDVVEVEFEFGFELEEVEWNSLAAATEKAAVRIAAPVASNRLVRVTSLSPRRRADGEVSDARVMPCSLGPVR